jgi:hypothetical protein
MTSRKRLSENERLGCFLLLFPPLWPLGIVCLICAGIEATAYWIGDKWRQFKARKDRR